MGHRQVEPIYQYFPLLIGETAYHGRVSTVPVTVGFKGRSHGLHLSIGTLNLESVLK